MKLKALITLLLLSLTVHSFAQLTVNAGNNTQICPGSSYTLGGTPTASGGTAPYTYAWSPSNNISSTTASNPIATPTVPTWYYVTVTDAAGNSAYDSVGVDINPMYLYNAGQDTDICIDATVTLGSPYNSTNGGVTYLWTPSTDLDNPTLPNPTSSTTATITYSVLISSPSCPSKSSDIKVTVHELPVVDACCYTVIHEGQTATLSATGATFYNWGGGNGNDISNTYGNPTTVEPVVTTQYVLYGMDQYGCAGWDTVTVEVIPDSSLQFYNTFSPNNDGINDFFYIGNIYKYPKCRLEVFTRTGQLVYAKTGYDNTWDGTNYGDKLPEATYYIVLDPGNGSPAYYKSVTIIR